MRLNPALPHKGGVNTNKMKITTESTENTENKIQSLQCPLW